MELLLLPELLPLALDLLPLELNLLPLELDLPPLDLDLEVLPLPDVPVSKPVASASSNNVRVRKKTTKKSDLSGDHCVPLPSDEDYTTFITSTTYTLPQLKHICRQFKLRLTGNKNELKQYIQTRLLRGWSARKIQKAWRNYWTLQWNRSRGPARFRRDLCVNPTDFCTMDSVADIPFSQFISYSDTDGKIYGFDMVSLFNLYHNDNLYASDLPINPYNRASIPPRVYRNLLRLINISTILFGVDILTEAEEEEERLEKERQQEEEEEEDDEQQRPATDVQELNLQPVTAQFDRDVAVLFRDIDHLGNYTNTSWFTQLERSQVLKMLVELNDIWSHRANLSLHVKREISPSGNPFLLAHCHLGHLETTDFQSIRCAALRVMCIFVYAGIHRDSRALGTMFVLGALTLVSLEAALALPWLYESMV